MAFSLPLTSRDMDACKVPIFRLTLCTLPLIQAFGIMGNLLSFNLLSARTLKCHSVRVYLKTLAIFDSSVIITMFLEWCWEVESVGAWKGEGGG